MDYRYSCFDELEFATFVFVGWRRIRWVWIL